ncbi:hypothetical protein DFH08DRAFT_965515 [Mycena albidolilacea]|uniref:Uncharacterized protein n=1 Tax=Mycena albidolilacea TaxID=1033008 RepID=A0AAD6ZQT4_9AGAR|nr:hypothetical protein DFH08DRAFT_965515 [Mycena albidolilacea]
MFNFLAHTDPCATVDLLAPVQAPATTHSWRAPFGTAPFADTLAILPKPTQLLFHSIVYRPPPILAMLCRPPHTARTPKTSLQLLAPPEPTACQAHPGCKIEANEWHPHVLALDHICWSSPYARARQRHLLAVLPTSEFNKAYTTVIGGRTQDPRELHCRPTLFPSILRYPPHI